MSILDNLLPQLFSDVVAIYDQQGNQLFIDARSIKVSIKEPTRIMEHPIETGSETTDHIIFLPIEMEMSLILTRRNYFNTYLAIKQVRSTATLLNVQTMTGLYPNMLIGDIPHEESPEKFDVISMQMHLKQAQFSTSQYDVLPKDPNNSDTVDRGTQEPATIPPAQSDTYAKQIADMFK